MRTLAALMALAALSACSGAAQEQPHGHPQDEAIFSSVSQVLCAESRQERAQAIGRLADQVESYRPEEEGDTATSAVEAALSEPESCDNNRS